MPSRFNDSFKSFVSGHCSDNLQSLLLQRSKWPEVDLSLVAEAIASRRKLASKCPRWAEDDIICPVALSAEQCSGEAAARHKAAVVSLLAKPSDGGAFRIADLTGGIGVDTSFFASIEGAQVLYNEMKPILCEAAENNFAALGLSDWISISNLEVGPGNIDRILEDFHPHAVYMDPARRSSTGSKVFRLADCQPDVTELADKVLGSGAALFVKLSPMADITQLLRELPPVARIDVVESGQECKEILLSMLPAGNPQVTPQCVVSVAGTPHSFEFTWGSVAPADLFDGTLQSGMKIFEPGKGLMKSGAWNLFASRHGLKALGVNSHVFVAPDDFSPQGMGRLSVIREALEFSKRSIARVGAEYPGSDVASHALPLSPEELSRRLAACKPAPGIPRRPEIRICGVGVSATERHLLVLEPQRAE